LLSVADFAIKKPLIAKNSATANCPSQVRGNRKLTDIGSEPCPTIGKECPNRTKEANTNLIIVKLFRFPGINSAKDFP
jgi:hypothetical protein